MSNFFRPYEGKRPYVFISYAHRQSAEVVGTIRILHEKGCRLWYDEGIPAGSDWPANIAQHMQECEKVIFFLSERALESPNCFSEMRTASRLGKPILIVHLEEAQINEEWKAVLKGSKELAILLETQERANAIMKSGFLPKRFYHSLGEKIRWKYIGLAASLLLFASSAAVLGLFASQSREKEPAPIPVIPEKTVSQEAERSPVVELGEAERLFAVRFPDDQQEKAVRKALQIQEDPILRGQLAEITELYFCGNLNPNSLASISFDANGGCHVNGAPVIQGSVKDLSLLAMAVKLEKLALIHQPFRDLSALGEHVLLKELSLAGNELTNLNSLPSLPSLEIIHLEHTQIKDLTELERFPRLQAVTVSRDMLPLTWNQEAGFLVYLTPDL